MRWRLQGIRNKIFEKKRGGKIWITKILSGFSPSPTYIKNIVLAFFVGGAICELGYLIQAADRHGDGQELAGIWSTVALICGAQIITGLGWYNTLGRIGGAGAAVPITGFANSIVAPAMEYKKGRRRHGRRS